jgi:glycosyltransferase involved in cell wall biosynthesis
MFQGLSERMVALGHDVSVVTANMRYPWQVADTRIEPLGPRRERVGGVPVLRLRHKAPAERWLARLRRWPVPGRGELRRWVRRLPPTTVERQLERILLRGPRRVVVAGGVDLYNVRAAVAARRRRAFPLVLVPTLHDDDPFSDPDAARAHLRAADAVVALTTHEARRMREEFGVDPRAIHVSALGVDVPPGAPAAAGAREPLVVFLGRKAPEKGTLDLLQAMHRVWRRIPQARVAFLGVAWNGHERLDEAIAALPAELRARVENPYGISEAQKARWLSRAACLALPSRYESFGIVICEAWMHGAVPVAYGLPALRCVIDEGVNGLLVRPGDVAGLGDALLDVLADPTRARALALAGGAKLRTEYTWDAAVRRFVAAYRCAAARVAPT